MNVNEVLESMEPIIREELGHHSERDLNRVRLWLENSLERHAFLDHAASAGEEAARSFGLADGYPGIDLRAVIYSALDSALDAIRTEGDLLQRHLVDSLDDADLAMALRLTEIACDHYDGKPLDVAVAREDLRSARRWASARHLRVAE